MKFNKILKNIEYSTKEALAYYIIALEQVNYSQDNELGDYMKVVINNIENTNQKEVLDKINMDLIANFPFHHLLNSEEILSYGIVIFDRLLHYNKEFYKQDIVKVLEDTMRLYSSRTILEKAEQILQNYK